MSFDYGINMGQCDLVPVYLVYYSYNDDVSRRHPRWWMNWLAAKATKSDYIHVEMVFDDGDTYTIRMGGQVERTPAVKSYTKDQYTCQEVYIQKWNVFHMKAFLDSTIDNSSFNFWGFYLLPFWPMSGATKNAWFCSELISTALSNYGGLDLGQAPYTISPGRLFEIINEKNYGNIRTMLKAENKPTYLPL